MKKLFQMALIATAVFTIGASAQAQGKSGKYRDARREYKQEVREARREYRDDIRDGDSRRRARREYRNEVREARREYRQDTRDARRDNNYYRDGRIYNRPPYGRAYGYRNVRPYVGNRRGYVVRQYRRY